jgi:hypothetical protein
LKAFLSREVAVDLPGDRQGYARAMTRVEEKVRAEIAGLEEDVMEDEY